MIRLLMLCAFLALSVWIGINLHQEQGMVLIAVRGKSIEMSLWVGALIAILSFIVLYFMFRMLGILWNIGDWFSSFGDKRRHLKSVRKTNQGLLALAEGRWKNAEKFLIRGVKNADTPLLNYLSAARAAQELGDFEKRDRYLALAEAATDGGGLAVGLTQAQLQISQGQYEQSLATLLMLERAAPKHELLLRLLKKNYICLKDWQSLIALLPRLKKSGGVDAEEIESLYQLAYLHTMRALNGADFVESKALWSKMPNALHVDPELVYEYVRTLVRHQQVDEAESVIKSALKKHWSEGLVALFGQLKSSHPARSLSAAEGWLKYHGESSALLLTCGRLAAQNELWAKAERYLEACLNTEHKPEAYALLGLIYEKMDKPQLSAECFRKGLIESASVSMQQSGLLLHHQSGKNEPHVD